MNGQDINGWFIGFIESQNNTYFFSTNIQSEQRATGSKASDGALSTRIDSSHKYKHLPTLQELTYTPILAVFQKTVRLYFFNGRGAGGGVSKLSRRQKISPAAASPTGG